MDDIDEIIKKIEKLEENIESEKISNKEKYIDKIEEIKEIMVSLYMRMRY